MLAKILIIFFVNSVISGIMYSGNYFYPKLENYRRTQENIWIPKPTQRPRSDPVTFYRNNRRIVLNNGYQKEEFPSRMPSLYTNGHFGKKLFTPHTGIFKYPGLPLFEADEDESPVIIYHGPQAEIVYKTLGSSIPYPMEEPVPGQMLHPPIVPRFKAIPLPIYGGTTSTTTTPAPYYYSNHNNNYFNNQKRDSYRNVTMIPFYEHEAIPDPRSNLDEFLNITPRPTAAYKSDSLPSVVYGIPYHQYVKNYPTYISPDNKKYASYTKQEDVNIKPIYEQIEEDVYPTISPENVQTGTHFTPNRQINAPFDHFIADSTSPMPRTVSSTSINRTIGDEHFRIIYDIPSADDPDLNMHEQLNNTYSKSFPHPKKSVYSAKYGGFKVSSSYKASPGKYYKYKKLKSEKKPQPVFENFVKYEENEINPDHNEHSYFFTSNGLPDVVLEKPKAESRRDYKDWILYES